MSPYTKLRRIPFYSNDKLVLTVIQGKLFGLFWVYIKMIKA